MNYDFYFKQVVNHGIAEALLDKIYELTKQFFALSTEEKQKYARETGSFQDMERHDTVG